MTSTAPQSTDKPNAQQDLMPAGKQLFSLKETAAILCVSEKTVSRYLSRNLLKESPAMRHKRITRESIEAFVQVVL